VEPSSAPWRDIDAVEPEPGREPEPRGRPWVAVAALAMAVVVAAGTVLAVAGPSAGVAVDGAAITEAARGDQGGSAASGPASSSRELVVDVGGAVARPGVYRLSAGSRVADAIEAAGGYGPRVDPAAADRTLNLAARLSDGDEVHVPSRDEAASAAPAAPRGTGAGGLVDLNRASAQDLDALPGIGPATAAKIIAAREQRAFASVDDFAARKVVGTATLAKIRPLVTVGG
jgi:competence protein ComEA